MPTKTEVDTDTVQSISNKTFVAPILQSATCSGDPVIALGVATKQYADSVIAAIAASIVNPIINGNMEIVQRGTTFAAPLTGAYSLDHWNYRKAGGGGGVLTINQSTNVPSVANAGILFSNSLEVDITTADASISAAEYYLIGTYIEGYNWRPFAQRAFAFSFWVMSSKTGTHCAVFRCSDRSYVAEYTINVADTWEFKTIAVPASPSAGTWNYTNGVGLEIDFMLAAGSNFQGTAGVWTASATLRGTANQVNVFDNTANFFRITGIKMELGSVATPIQFRSFQDEFLLCQRYYRKSFPYATTPIQNVGNSLGAAAWHAPAPGGAVTFSLPVDLGVPMRSTGGVVILYNPFAANAEVRNLTDLADCSASVGNHYSESQLTVTTTGTAGTATGERLAVHWAIDEEL